MTVGQIVITDWSQSLYNQAVSSDTQNKNTNYPISKDGYYEYVDKNYIATNIYYRNLCINKSFEYQTSYYIKFSLKKFKTPTKIKIYLRDTLEGDGQYTLVSKAALLNNGGTYQFIKEIELDGGDPSANEYQNFEITFKSLIEKDESEETSYGARYLYFEIQRDADEFNSYETTIDDKTYKGKILTPSSFINFKIYSIKNLLKENGVSIDSCSHIGVQGPPTILLNINGEEVRTGYNGIYELIYDDIDITSIGVCGDVSASSPVIIDYYVSDKED